MSGILAQSASQTMTSGDTAADKSISGYIRNERITFGVTPLATTSYLWSLGLPSGSSSAKAYLTDTTGSAPALVPDRGGTYTISCVVDGTTTYAMRLTALDTASSEPAEALRFTPRADAQVGTPSLGAAVYWSSTQNALALKYPDGSVHTVPTGAPMGTIHFGKVEARPLSASTSFADLFVWSWEDHKEVIAEGTIASTDLTFEAYRDCPQIKPFVRHDQNNSVSLEIEMPHTWAGTNVRLHVHTIPMVAPSPSPLNAYFSGSYYFGNRNAELPAFTSWTAFNATIAVATGEEFIRKSTAVATCVAPVSPLDSDFLSVFIQREGDSPSDTYTTSKVGGTAAANLAFVAVDVHYQKLLTGSEEEHSGGHPAINPSVVTFNPDLYVDNNIYLQMAIKSDAGNACTFQLYDVGAAAVVAGTTVITTSTSYEVVELGPLSLTAGSREYKIQAKYNSVADEPKLASAAFVVR